ncbi:MAG: DUF1573 domain-containing protein [Lentisphaeraceae bacterium]|nr:DUF1573 domain-containing protein [Lentisphaeraceae bacterium]
MRLLFTLSIYLIFSAFTQAELKWESKTVKQEAKLNDQILELVFVATNTSNQNLVVKSAKPSCDCMTVTSRFPVELAPGEELEVKVNYDTEGKVGLNRGRVTVETAEKKDTLLVEVTIPTAVTLTPRFLIWKKGERDEKSVTIKIHPDWQGSIDKAEVKSKKDAEEVAVSLVKEEGVTLVKISPVEELAKKRTWVIISGKDENGKSKDYRVYLIFN